MDKQQKKLIKKYVSWALLAAIVVLLACMPMIASKDQAETGPKASVLTAQAESRAISTVILGGGKLIGEDAVEITIPAEVKIKEYLVQNGDLVTKGQPIARVDRVSVMTAISAVQETMEQIRKDLNSIAGKKESTQVNAKVSGTVKTVYGTEGELVQDVVLRDGALAVLSLDGLMAVQIHCTTRLTGGDMVYVTLSDGTKVEGKVKSNLDGVLTVTAEDDGYPVGDSVTVFTEDGREIGSGSLYIHSQWNVLAYSGSISRVHIRAGMKVSIGKRLFDLENTGYSAQFDALSRKHRQYEELMLELFKMYQSETVVATQDGMVSGVDEDGTYMLSDSGTGWTLSLLANAPNGNDEPSYTNYVGQVTEVAIDGLILKINPTALSVSDYKDLSGVPTDTDLMTYQTSVQISVPVYELSDGEWLQISASSIVAGDILLFSGTEGSFVWIIRIAHVQLQPDTPAPSEPTEPTEPTTPTEPDSPTTPTDPARPGLPGGKFPQGGGRFPSMGGGAGQQQGSDEYTLDTVTIASVTAQDNLTVQISIDELDIRNISVGQAVTVTLDALRGEVFSGTVTVISGSAVNGGGNSKFTVDITVPKAENMLPGMTAHVKIVLDTADAAVSIPVAALIDIGTETVVYTGYDEETESFVNPVAVTAGISDGEYVQILSGLTAGQTVYYPYYDTVVISNKAESGFSFTG